MCNCCDSCYGKVEAFISKCFAKYGRFVARYPWVFIICSAILFGGLGIGLIRLEPEIDLELGYTPRNSEASKDRNYLYEVYPDASVSNFSSRTLPNLGLFADVIVKAKDRSDMFGTTNLNALQNIYNSVVNDVTVRIDGVSLKFDDLCAKGNSDCAVSGYFVFTPAFQADLTGNAVTYPFYNNLFLPNTFGGVSSSAGKLSSAKYIRLRFNLRQDGGNADKSEQWQQSFKDYMESVTSAELDFAFAHTDSMEEELDANAKGDIIFMSLTFTLMITYAVFAISGGNCLSNRGFLANVGVLATGLAILGALGLNSACGVEFVSIVGVMPFLVMGIGVDDMFILLSGLADVQHLPTVEERIGETMRSAGLAITITSVTDLLGFCVGSVSVFLSVKNFCIYTGVAVIFCYINQITFFTGCMALHERRVLAFRHSVTCMKLKSKDEMQRSGASKVAIICCSGSSPKSREDVEGLLERYPRKALLYVLKFPLVRIMSLFLFAVYLGVAIWGATQTKQGLVLKDTVSDTSYYYTYETFLSELSNDHFVSFIFKDGVEYWETSVSDGIQDMISSAQALSSIRDSFSYSWIDAFVSSGLFDNSSEAAFVTNLQTFLDASTDYVNDVVITNDKIVSSRVYVLTENIPTSNSQADLMIDVRKIAETSPLSVIAYAPPFIFYEQYTSILSSTLQTVGITIAAVVVATFLFMPHILMMVFVIISLLMIVVGVFGYMYFWGITLSSITMILLIMSVGFAVDYSIHTSHAFLQADKPSRIEKMFAAINMAAAPIVNAALSSFVGIFMLLFAKSYIFQTFFKIMFLVILLGFLHSTFFLPSLLSLIGPMGSARQKRETTRRRKRTPSPKKTRVSPILTPRATSPTSTRDLDLAPIDGDVVPFTIPRPKIIYNPHHT